MLRETKPSNNGTQSANFTKNAQFFQLIFSGRAFKIEITGKNGYILTQSDQTRELEGGLVNFKEKVAERVTLSYINPAAALLM